MIGVGMEEISRNEIKKKRFFIAVIVAVLLVGCVAIISNFNDKSGKELYPMPEKMVVYYNGEATELTQQDEAFSKLYMLNTLPKKKDIMETAIDPDGVAECNEDMAVEFVYGEKQMLPLNQGERNFTKLLFVYSGWCEKNVIFYNDGAYQSGTILHNISEYKVRKTYEEYIGG